MEIDILRIVEWTNKKLRIFNYFTKLQKLIYLKRLLQYIVFKPCSRLFFNRKGFLIQGFLHIIKPLL